MRKSQPAFFVFLAIGLPDHCTTEIGSKLFTRRVTGARVVDGKSVKDINGHVFHSWGAHSDHYLTQYLTTAASIGMQKSDVDSFVKKLSKILEK